MLGPEIGEETTGRAHVGCKEESDSTASSLGVELEERLLWQQLRDHNAAVAAARGVHVRRLHGTGQRRLFCFKHFHLAVRIQRLQLCQNLSIARLAHTFRSKIEVGAQVLDTRRCGIPHCNTPHVGQDEILCCLNTDASAANDEDVQIFQSCHRVASECGSLPTQPIRLFVHCSSFNLPRTHPLTPGWTFGGFLGDGFGFHGEQPSQELLILYAFVLITLCTFQ
mmetsp:Transcript_13474/g.25095  ORF Transcript_13474/g.25095 Transcript_13474/m.25095 type:complete len:224 (+) Transcript_13474:668-1339(+)